MCIEYDTLEGVGVQGGREGAIVAMVEQGTEAWLNLRMGVLSASHANKVITGGGKVVPRSSRATYMELLAGQRITGKRGDDGYKGWEMERGNELESKARFGYEFATARTVKQVGFVFMDQDRLVGCSPDGLCADRPIEIKCPILSTVIHYLYKGEVPTKYKPQINFQMWVLGIQQLDFIVYCDEDERLSEIWTVEADPVFQAAFAIHVPAFLADVAEIEDTIRKKKQL